MAADIEASVVAFAKDLTTLCAALRAKRIAAQAAAGKGAKEPAAQAPKGPAAKTPAARAPKAPAARDPKGGAAAKAAAPPPPEITFALDKGAATKVRTPEEQAAQVAAGRSWVCWGAHMADSARHVIMKVDGKVAWEPKKAFGDDWPAFEKLWAATMKKHALKNAKGGDGWFSGDGFHLELADSKMSKDDPRCKACLEEYARLTRTGKNKPNDKFEKAYVKLLAPYIAKYEKKEPAAKTAKAAAR